MCGIFGWSFRSDSKATLDQRAALVTALSIYNESRGDSSWGVHLLGKGKGKTFKGVGPITGCWDVWRWTRYALGFAHTRQPTTGSVTRENAHPFTYQGITMAHNGIIYNHDDLNEKFLPGDRRAVDSEHLLLALAGVHRWDEIEGYGSIEWAREDTPNNIWVCKMRQGSLAIRGVGGGPKNVHGVVWSSDEDHLESACQMAGLQTFRYECKEAQIYQVVDGKLYMGEGTIAIKPSGDNWRKTYAQGWDEDTCPVCGNWVTKAGYCYRCGDDRAITVTDDHFNVTRSEIERALVGRREEETTLECEVADMATQLGLKPSGSRDFKSESGCVVTYEEVLDVVLQQHRSNRNEWPRSGDMARLKRLAAKVNGKPDEKGEAKVIDLRPTGGVK